MVTLSISKKEFLGRKLTALKSFHFLKTEKTDIFAIKGEMRKSSTFLNRFKYVFSEFFILLFEKCHMGGVRLVLKDEPAHSFNVII